MPIDTRYTVTVTTRDKTYFEGAAEKVVITPLGGRIRVKARYASGRIKKYKVNPGSNKTLRPGGRVRVEIKSLTGFNEDVRIEVDKITGPAMISELEVV